MRIFLTICAALLSGCNADTLLAPLSGAYSLRVVHTGVDGRVTVPGTYPSVGDGDSVRIVAGSFELLPSQGWRSKWERVLVTDGVESERRTFDAAGTYRITSSTDSMTVLDLYPGQVVVAVITTTAVIRGDTLHHGAFLYAR